MIGGIYTMYVINNNNNNNNGLYLKRINTCKVINLSSTWSSIEGYDDVSIVQVFQLQSAIADLLISLIEETTMDGINVAKVTTDSLKWPLMLFTSL